MKRSFCLFALAVLFAVGVAYWSVIGSSSAQEKGKAKEGKGAVVAPPPPKWEYKVKTVEGRDNESFEKELNEMGEEGWELGGTVSKVNAGNSGPLRLIFKRAKR
jgi:hypothetical protein